VFSSRGIWVRCRRSPHALSVLSSPQDEDAPRQALYLKI
jgi:hypothetical protein